MQLKALEAILSVFAANPRNFALLQPLHTISHLLEGFERYNFELKDSILRLLVLVVTISNCVPFQELAGMSTLVNENVSASTMALIFQTATKLVNFDPQYKVILQVFSRSCTLLIHLILTRISLRDCSICSWHL
jgi:hypothetical protein